MRLLILLVLLAGCSSLDTADLTVAGGPHDIDTTMSFDATSHPTAHLYEANGREHAGYYTAHDMLFEWADQNGHDLELEWFDSSFGFGFTLCAIDDFPPKVQEGVARGCFERGGFWSIQHNGEDAMVGMSEIEIQPGDSLGLTWTAA